MGYGSADRRSLVVNLPDRQGSFSSPTLTILYDNTQYDPRLRSGWGFSCLVEGHGKTLMFDTSGDGRRLLSHMEIMGKDPEKIQMVFLSHSHGDHTGGLWGLCAHNPGLEVSIPKSFSTGFDEAPVRRNCKVIRIGSPTEISPGVFSTGEMGMWTREQSLILDAGKGSILLTGCAHPGIMAVIKRAKALISTQIRLVMGGYHLFSEGEWEIMKTIRSFHESGVERVCPCHCTGEGAVDLFRESYGEGYIEGGVGRVIEIS